MNHASVKRQLELANRERDLQQLATFGLTTAQADGNHKHVMEMFAAAQLLVGRETNFLLRAIVQLLHDLNPGSAGCGAPVGSPPVGPDGFVSISLDEMPESLRDLFKSAGIDLDAVFGARPAGPAPEPEEEADPQEAEEPVKG